MYIIEPIYAPLSDSGILQTSPPAHYYSTILLPAHVPQQLLSSLHYLPVIPDSELTRHGAVTTNRTFGCNWPRDPNKIFRTFVNPLSAPASGVHSVRVSVNSQYKNAAVGFSSGTNEQRAGRPPRARGCTRLRMCVCMYERVYIRAHVRVTREKPRQLIRAARLIEFLLDPPPRSARGARCRSRATITDGRRRCRARGALIPARQRWVFVYFSPCVLLPWLVSRVL